MQRLAGYLYQANPAGGLAEVFPVGTLRSDLPDWVKVDDGAFVDLEPAAPAASDEPAGEDQADDDTEDDDEEDQGDLDSAPPAKASRRRSAR